MAERRYHVEKKDEGVSLLDYLAPRLALSRKKTKALLDRRRVYVNRRLVWMGRHTLRRGDVVEVHEAPHDDHELDLPILLRTNRAIVVNKPAGLLSNDAENSVEARLRRQLGETGIRAVHRLDRDTTGCNLFATTQEHKEALVDLFRKQKVRKTYRALVIGKPDFHCKTVNTRLDGKTAVSHVQVLHTLPLVAVVRIDIETGRTHQIRRHLAGLGHPVVGDRKYGDAFVPEDELRGVQRTLLHAERIEVQGSTSLYQLTAEAAVPKDMRDITARMRER